MSIAPEIFYGVGALILLAALIWGVIQYRSRNRANDRITEKATREMYKHPETYPEKRKHLEKDIKPS